MTSQVKNKNFSKPESTFGVENYEAFNLDKTEEDWEKCFGSRYATLGEQWQNIRRAAERCVRGEVNIPPVFCSPRLKD